MHRNQPVSSGRIAVRRSSRISTVRSGFTLLETFVVIAIVGVLVSLLFTAVQTVRESARKTQCANNLRQIGIATQLFIDSTKKTPFEQEPGPWVGWRVRLLPFLGEEVLSDAYDRDREWSDPENEPLRAQMPALYDCPNAQSIPHERASYEALAGRVRKEPGDGEPEGRWPQANRNLSEHLGRFPFIVEVDDPYAEIWLQPELRDSLFRAPIDPLPEEPTVEEILEYWRRSPLISSRGLIGHHFAGFHALYGDGTVRFARGLFDDDTLRASAEEIVSQNDP